MMKHFNWIWLTFVPQILSSISGEYLNKIESGDYMWIDTNYNEGTPHGLIVVGWQEAKACPDIILNATTSTPPQMFLSYDLALTTVLNPVPYVADYTTAVSPIPRPFYCTRYQQGQENRPSYFPDPSNSVISFAPHNMRFYRMPDQISIPFSVIYTNLAWQWSE
jgi:hypothetical protein